MPDGRISQVRFEVLASRPGAFPFATRFKRWFAYAPCHRLRPQEFLGCLHPVPSPWTLAFDPSGGSRHFRYPHTPILVRETISGLHYRSLSLRPVDLLALLSELTRSSPSRRG